MSSTTTAVLPSQPHGGFSSSPTSLISLPALFPLQLHISTLLTDKPAPGSWQDLPFISNSPVPTPQGFHPQPYHVYVLPAALPQLQLLSFPVLPGKSCSWFSLQPGAVDKDTNQSLTSVQYFYELSHPSQRRLIKPDPQHAPFHNPTPASYRGKEQPLSPRFPIPKCALGLVLSPRNPLRFHPRLVLGTPGWAGSPGELLQLHPLPCGIYFSSTWV